MLVYLRTNSKASSQNREFSLFETLNVRFGLNKLYKSKVYSKMPSFLALKAT